MSKTRRFRRYKGWAFDPYAEMFLNLNGYRYASAATLIHLLDLTDDDHAPLMDLKKNPHEPVPKLEDMILTCGNDSHNSREQYANELARRLRAAFPHIDTPEGA